MLHPLRPPILGALLLLALLLGAVALAQRPSGMSPAPFDDHEHTMRTLGLRSLRRGPDPNDPANHDETVANRLMSTLPDALTMNDGRKVTRPEQWPERREELVELFEREVYGRVPKNVPPVRWEVVGMIAGESRGIPTITRQLIGHVEDPAYPSIKVAIDASFTVPARRTGPVPAMIEFSFGFLPGMRRAGSGEAGLVWTDEAIARGWGYGFISPYSIQYDTPRVELGIIGLCNRGGPRKPDDWGTLRAWGWGVSRLIDAFEQNREWGVDPRGVGIEGVSRFGKAAIVAQAFDPRVAVAFVASSGEGGTKLHRRLFGEQIENLAGGEFYWMAGNIIKYGADDPRRTSADLPVDSHELIALCAPRPCFISHGVVEKGDAYWIDAHGSFMAGVLAGPVYRLLGATDFGTPGDFLTDKMPPVGTLIGGELAWRQHDGGHEARPNWLPFFDWIGRYIPAPPVSRNRTPLAVPSGTPTLRSDPNSLAAHWDMREKASQGGIDLYFAGDSITRRWGTSDAKWAENYKNWTTNFFGWNAGNFGWGGDTTGNILWRLRSGELDGVNPKVVVLLGGTNDIGNGASAEATVAGLRAILNTVRAKAPRAKVILTAIFPREDRPGLNPTIEAVNRRLAQMADGKTVRFLSVNDHLTDASGRLLAGTTIDGLHLSPQGYQVWADGLKPHLLGWLGPRAATDHAPPPTGDPSATPPPQPGK